MAIAFACPGCGKKFKVEDEKAGRKGKCPSCESVFQIPVPRRPAAAEDDGFEVVEEGPRRTRAEPPRRRPDDDEDDRPRRWPPPVAEDDEDDRPRRRRPAEDDEADEAEDDYEAARRRHRRKKKQKTSTGLIVGLVGGAVGLLLLVGLGIWLIVRMTGSTTVQDDLKYLPDNCEAFLTAKMDAVVGSELYKRLRQEATLLKDFEQRILGELALELADVERLTAGSTAGDGSPVMVLRSKKSVDLNDLLAKNPKKYNQDESYGPYKVRHDGLYAISVPERKTVVMGPVLMVKKIFERGGKKADLSSGLQAVFKELDLTKTIAAAADLSAGGAQGLALQPRYGGLLRFFSLMPLTAFGSQITSLVSHMDVGATLIINQTSIYKSAQDAERAKREYDEEIAKLMGPKAAFIPREIIEMVKSIQIVMNGDRISSTLSPDANTVVEAAKKIPGLPEI